MPKDPTPQAWAAAVLKRLGIKQTPGAVQALTGWAKAEGGHWNNDARYNPLNTTQPMSGAGNTGTQGNIKVYRNWDQGIQATVKTLKNGRYGGILDALASGNPDAVGSAIGQTPWGTAGGLVQKTIAGTPRVAGVQPYGGGTPAPRTATRGASPTYGQQTVSTPAVDNSVLRRQLVGQFLQQGGVANTSALLTLAGSYGQASDIPGTSKTTYNGASSSTSASPKLKRGKGATAALAWAESKLGSRETEGENRGGLASYANQRFGMSGQPWCAMFTSLAVTKGGAPKSARTASVADVRAKARAGMGYKRGAIDPAKAKAGDLILFGDRHIGMVKKVKNGQVIYVGGNQSDSVTEASVPVGEGEIVRPLYKK